MNDQDLLMILENGGQVPVPYFDGDMTQIIDCDIARDEALEALKNFLALTNEQRLSDGRHLVAYCKMMIDAVGEEILEDMDGVEPTVAQIWDYVRIKYIFFGKLEVGKYASKPTVYVEIEGEVAWEPEHGLQMSWADGSQLVKVGAFDGHPTNGHAMADPTRDQHVFSCYDLALCTFPDPR